MHSLPTLTSPALLLFIALIFAIAAYLRQVSERATDLIEKIWGNEVPIYPLGKHHTDGKLDALQKKIDGLRKAAPWIIQLVIALAIYESTRLFVGALPSSRFQLFITTQIFPWVDLGFSIILIVLFCLLYRMHNRTRDRDKQVLEKTMEWLILEGKLGRHREDNRP